MTALAAELEVLYGTNEPPAVWRTLTAGHLAVDLENGQLRYLRWCGVEVLRGVSFQVRDDHWGTYVAEIEGIEISEQAGRFRVRYGARCARGAGDFVFRAEVTGEAGGLLRFEVNGRSETDLLTNRTGFVMLHPLAGVVGQPIMVEHTDGRCETILVPEGISPHEPIRDIFTLTHTPAPGLSVRVAMTGDAYDMEDQRNWTDASLKSYVRPLSKPWPYVIAAGEEISQSISVTLTGDGPVASRSVGARVELEWQMTAGAFPRLGIAVAGADAVEALNHTSALLGIGASRLILSPAAVADLADLARLQQALSLPATLAFAIPAINVDAELRDWADCAAAAGLAVGAVIATPYRLYPDRPAGARCGDASLEAMAAGARVVFPHAEIGGGALTGFPEFNRNRPPIEGLAFVTHSTSAIVHAADDRSVMESLEALPQLFASGRAIAGARSYRVGPASIGLALNPDGPPRWRKAADGRQTMVRNDPRHAALFGAAWAIGYAAAAAPIVDELTLGHATGDFGALGPGGKPRPIYHVLRGLARGQGKHRLAVTAGDNRLAALGFVAASSAEIWLANLSPDTITVGLPKGASIALLDASVAAASLQEVGLLDRSKLAGAALELGAFAVARVMLS